MMSRRGHRLAQEDLLACPCGRLPLIEKVDGVVNPWRVFCPNRKLPLRDPNKCRLSGIVYRPSEESARAAWQAMHVTEAPLSADERKPCKRCGLSGEHVCLRGDPEARPGEPLIASLAW